MYYASEYLQTLLVTDLLPYITRNWHKTRKQRKQSQTNHRKPEPQPTAFVSTEAWTYKACNSFMYTSTFTTICWVEKEQDSQHSWICRYLKMAGRGMGVSFVSVCCSNLSQCQPKIIHHYFPSDKILIQWENNFSPTPLKCKIHRSY